jgi:hypothetical protein
LEAHLRTSRCTVGDEVPEGDRCSELDYHLSKYLLDMSVFRAPVHYLWCCLIRCRYRLCKRVTVSNRRPVYSLVLYHHHLRPEGWNESSQAQVKNLGDKLDDSYLPGRSLPSDASSIPPQTLNLTCVYTSRIAISAGLIGVMNCAAVDVTSVPANCTAGCMAGFLRLKAKWPLWRGKGEGIGSDDDCMILARVFNSLKASCEAP